MGVFAFVFQQFSVDFCTCLCRNAVGGRTSSDILIAFKQRFSKYKFDVHISVFPVVNGKGSVRRKAVVRQWEFFLKMIHVLPDDLFSGSDNEHDLFIRLYSAVLKILHGIETGYDRPFIVHHSSSVEVSVLKHKFKRICIPFLTVSLRNHVHVDQDPQSLIAFPEFHSPYISVFAHPCGKTHFLSPVQNKTQGFLTSLPFNAPAFYGDQF